MIPPLIQSPFFSIVIPLYNAGAYIEMTIRSILYQTCQDFEIVVVNDGSTDGGDKVVQTIKDARIRIVHQKNAGASAARNHGIQEACGEVIAFLDADDVWHPYHLQIAQTFFQKNPQYDWFFSKVIETSDINLEEIQKTVPQRVSYRAINWFLEASHIPMSTSSFIRRSIIPLKQLFPTGIKMYEDTIAWCRIAMISPMIGTSNYVTAYYRMRENSASHIYHAQRAGLSCAGLDSFLIQQDMYLSPDCPPEGKIFFRFYALLTLWSRIRKASLISWIPEFQQRQPVLGKMLTRWLIFSAHCSRFFYLAVAKIIRIRLNSVIKTKDKLAKKTAIQLQEITHWHN